jgi:hypothetical protein
MNRPRRRLPISLGIGLIGVGSLQLSGPPESLRTQPVDSVIGARSNPASPGGLEAIRQASVSWERRKGPMRQVVDMVCLVPDAATFLEAIAAWDETHAFPILIEDVELTFKFLRAFRPARIVRFPRKVAPVPANRLWDAATTAVGRSWSSAEKAMPGDASGSLRGDVVPKRLGPTSPGLVLSNPTSPMLAGAVALAAGRFQPLLRWETPRRFADVPSREEALALALDLEAHVATRFDNYRQLGDDCDFLTLAGDWPYRYQDRDGPAAFDDLIGRSAGGPSQERWAFTGRLLGDPTASVYRAMCSLFLQPDAALLLNTYTDPNAPWSVYALVPAAGRLARIVPVTLREGIHAGLKDWVRIFDPINRFGLVLINTQGSPTVFQLPGGPGETAHVPPSVPTAVLMIHSFSAADPTDPATIAGRWLANGSFVYFGSMNEPYLQAFRPPALVTELLAAGLPMGAAIRLNPPEPFSQPWRLVYLGDPLYRLVPLPQRPPRLELWPPVSTWPADEEYPQPAAASSDATRLIWAQKSALYRFQHSARPSQPIDLATVLLGIRREQLDERLRPVHDALLVDTLLDSDRPRMLLEWLSRIPAAERASLVQRTCETLHKRFEQPVEKSTGSGPG